MSGLIETYLQTHTIEGNVLAESSSFLSGLVTNPINYTTDNFFQADRQTPGEWWQISFIAKLATISTYKLKTFDYGEGYAHLKSWTLSASNDNETFVILDMKVDDISLNGANKEATFPLSRDFGPFNIFRITIIQSHHLDIGRQYRLSLNQFDIFGVLVGTSTIFFSHRFTCNIYIFPLFLTTVLHIT